MREIEAMTNRVMKRAIQETPEDEAMRNVDEAVDVIIASIMAIEENLPQVRIDTVRQKAAVDTTTKLMDEAIKPYFADIVKALQAFD
jgi:hypothetical protein